MSSLRPDQHAPHTPPQAAQDPPRTSESRGSSSPAPKLNRASTDSQIPPHDALEHRHASAPAKGQTPPGGPMLAQPQMRSPQTEPAMTRATGPAKPTAAGQAQYASAKMLLHLDPAHIDSLARAACKSLLAACDHPEGFKTVALGYTSNGARHTLITCHEPGMASSAPAEHKALLKNLGMYLAKSSPQEFGLPKAEAMSLGQATTMFAISGAKSGNARQLAASGTRLIRSAADGTFHFAPSGSYPEAPSTLGAKTAEDLATLHANLLLGAQVPAEKLVDNPRFPSMSDLTAAVRATLLVAAAGSHAEDR